MGIDRRLLSTVILAASLPLMLLGVYRLHSDSILVPLDRLPLLRRDYIDDVRELKYLEIRLRLDGKSCEEVATELHQKRRDIGARYKLLTPEPLRTKLYMRNIQKYGDKLGPTIKYLRDQGRTWEEIIGAASHSGGDDLGLSE